MSYSYKDVLVAGRRTHHVMDVLQVGHAMDAGDKRLGFGRVHVEQRLFNGQNASAFHREGT